MKPPITEHDLRDFAREALPTIPVPEVMAELSQFTLDPRLGNEALRGRIQYMILHIVAEEHGDLHRLRQLVSLAQADYRDIYLIVSLELQDMR
jgi:hypothetical protein